MKKPKRKWWLVKEFDVGRELGDPDYIQWADFRIKELEQEVAMLKDGHRISNNPR